MTVNDQFGITGYQSIGFAAFLQSSNINLVEQTVKGDYEVAVYNDVNREKTAALVDKIKGMTYFSVVDDTNLLYLVTVLTRPNTTENLASFMAKVDRTSNKLFKQFLKKTK